MPSLRNESISPSSALDKVTLAKSVLLCLSTLLFPTSDSVFFTSSLIELILIVVEVSVISINYLDNLVPVAHSAGLRLAQYHFHLPFRLLAVVPSSAAVDTSVRAALAAPER